MDLDDMNAAQFKLGKRVTLVTSAGLEVEARPFYYTELAGEGLKVELYTEGGIQLRCADEAMGAYSTAGMESLFLLRDPTTN